MIDAAGKLLLPGFNDAHVHFMDGGRELDNVDLKDASSPEEFVRRIAEQAKKNLRESGSSEGTGMNRCGIPRFCLRRS